MKTIHYVNITVYVKENDSSEDLGAIIAGFLPEDFENQEITLEQEAIAIDETTKMQVLRVSLSKSRHIKEFLALLKEALGKQQCARIVSEENRVDNKGALYIRLDKQSLLKKGEAMLTDGGDCFHFKIMLAAFPKTKENALILVKKLFA